MLSHRADQIYCHELASEYVGMVKPETKLKRRENIGQFSCPIPLSSVLAKITPLASAAPIFTRLSLDSEAGPLGGILRAGMRSCCLVEM